MQAREDGTAITVTTKSGDLRGSWHGGVARFAGVPFAAPPIGELRFRPPAPVEPWEGERSADSFGTISPQNPSLMDALFGGEAEQWDEDCLHLNVWTADPEASRPVMVWIHGGAFEMGSGSSALYDGEHFAHTGVVLVSLNYRLGALGFLELGDLDPTYRGSGNVGLLDQVAALEWVRDNIASFGGDPGNVTIFGESAGGMSVSLLLAMPSASGLFHAAIAQSGAASIARNLTKADDDTAEFCAAAGCATVAELVAAPVETLLAGHATMAASRMSDPEATARGTGDPLSFLAFRPVADGEIVPTDPLAAIRDGSAAGVPLLIGTTEEEWKLFSLITPAPADEDAIRRRLALFFDDVDGALEVYRREAPDASLADIESAVITDQVFRIPAVRLADAQSAHAPVWQYLFAWPSPAWGGQMGACHAIEIPFVFDLVEDQRLHVFVGPEAPRALARATHEAWVAFARDHEPVAAGLPVWSRVDEPGRPTMVLDTEPRLVDDPHGAAREFCLEFGRPFGAIA
ncbi:MAG TPA: carboxylesterase/lipase family protein [Microthrixaceae bacterium]|nr:carboxylesterase/lipase family protein [Microthrixaceae bacterium]